LLLLFTWLLLLFTWLLLLDNWRPSSFLLLFKLHALLDALKPAWLQHLRGAWREVGHVPGGSCGPASNTLTATLDILSVATTPCCFICIFNNICSWCCCCCCYCWLVCIAIVYEAVIAAIIS
jgi:hypothetical protein